jgi:imidazolonepropionase-like amidohydrolase
MAASILPIKAQFTPPTPRRLRLLSVPSLCVFAGLLFAQFWLLPQILFKKSFNERNLSLHHLTLLESGLQTCAEFNAPLAHYSEARILSRANPRWNAVSGQNETVILRNVTLFDGDKIFECPVDVAFSKGVFTAITSTSQAIQFHDAQVLEMDGKFVTPGLVDMHSHHLTMVWPLLRANDDTNEVNDAFGPLTPFVRSLDGMKPYDEATTMIRSGGITSSLILPGSANIMGGEAFIVKNVLRGGKDGEETVEEMLLEHGVPKLDQRRYMKMACGENPRRVYKHTRMGNAWIFRKHMERAVELKTRQDGWCLAAAVAREKNDAKLIASLTTSAESRKGGLPVELELESSVAILRGKVGVNVHCYEPEDFEDMLLHSVEFGFRIQAFHHALSAWKVPEMIKDSGQYDNITISKMTKLSRNRNITIATFADFSLYKQEAYGASLYAGKILADHDLPVAYKSVSSSFDFLQSSSNCVQDHSQESTNAKYLLCVYFPVFHCKFVLTKLGRFQAAMGHSFGLPEIKALQSVTSVPAKSLQQDHRIGYVKPGFDADLVVWDDHPLSVGATPLQVYVDGKATLDPKKVEESMPKASLNRPPKVAQPRTRPSLNTEAKDSLCESLATSGSRIVVTGITKSFLSDSEQNTSLQDNMTAVIDGGRVYCFGHFSACASHFPNDPVLHLKNGHLLPGLTAVSRSLGLREIASESSTGDGAIDKKSDVANPDNVAYAKYGVHLEGRGFKRAQIGGVTRSVTTPLTQGGFMDGVSVGIKTSEKKTVLDGGIFQEDVALHLVVGQNSKGKILSGAAPSYLFAVLTETRLGSDSTPSISLAVAKLRHILLDNKAKDNVFRLAANGTLPLVIHTDDKARHPELFRSAISC